MITIRYADLPEGLHAQAEKRGKRTIIYLRPGLTPEQRRQTLRRARQSARMGHGPRLPATEVAVAVAADIVGSTLRNATAALRSHVLVSLMLMGALTTGVACYGLFATGPLRLMLPPNARFQALPSPDPAPSTVQAGIGSRPHHRRRAAPVPVLVPSPQGGGGHRHARVPAPARSASPSPSASPSTARSPVPSTAAPSPSPSPTPDPVPSPGGPLCLLGICL